jgi:hypothetical protein
MLDILEWALEVIGVTYRRLDGGYVLYLDFFNRILLCLLAILSFFQDRCNRKADYSGHVQQRSFYICMFTFYKSWRPGAEPCRS